MFPSWFVGLNLGTINPLTFSITAENQRVIYSVVNLDNDELST